MKEENSTDIRPDEPKQKAIGIVEGQVAYTDANSPVHTLASSNASSCIIISIYNPETKEAALAHIYDQTNIKSLKEVFDNIKGSSKAEIQVNMSGAIAYAYEGKYERIIEFLKDVENIKIDPDHANHVGQNTGTESMSIDARTGKVTYTLEHLDIKLARPLSNDEYDAMRKPHDLTKVFDDRKISNIIGLLSAAFPANDIAEVNINGKDNKRNSPREV